MGRLLVIAGIVTLGILASVAIIICGRVHRYGGEEPSIERQSSDFAIEIPEIADIEEPAEALRAVAALRSMCMRHVIDSAKDPECSAASGSLARGLWSRDGRVRIECAWALATTRRVGQAQTLVLRRLTELASDGGSTSDDEALSRTLINSLDGELDAKDAAVLECLRFVLRNSISDRIRGDAACKLVEFGAHGEVAAVAVDWESPEASESALTGFATSDESSPSLLRAARICVTAPHSRIRAKAARLLGLFAPSDPEVLETLRKLTLTDPSPTVRSFGVSALLLVWRNTPSSRVDIERHLVRCLLDVDRVVVAQTLRVVDAIDFSSAELGEQIEQLNGTTDPLWQSIINSIRTKKPR